MMTTKQVAQLTTVILCFWGVGYALDGMVLQTSNPMFDGGNLIIHYLSTGQRKTLQTGTIYGPSFSPDGRRVAYGDQVRGRICIVDIGGNNRVEITSCGTTEPTVTWASDGFIYFGYCDRNIYRVRPDGTERSIVFTSDNNIHALSVSQNGQRAAWTKPAWSVAVADLVTRVERNFGGGCQGSISPDGALVTHNLGGHTTCQIKRWDGSVFKSIYSPEGTFNLHRWAHHAQDYVCYTIEGSNKGYIHNITTDQRWYVGTGICWDFFPQELQPGPATPDMRLSPSSLDFVGQLGGSATPSSAVINVTNSVSGTTLDPVTVSGVPTWLRVAVGGSGNSQTLTNTINMGEITAENVYNATITVRAANANPQTRTYTVRLTVRSAPVLTSIRVSPASATVPPNGTVQFTAEALDQYGTPLAQQPTFTWEALGGGTIDARGLFTAGPQLGGPYDIRASAGGRSGTASVTIAETPPVHLKLNCGGSGVPGWSSETPYLVPGYTGNPYDFGSAPSVSGVANAAPAEVYRTVRHENHRYSFPDLPNGTYIVRFHFYDAYAGSERRMDYTVEGVKVIDDLCIAAAAGGAKILVREFEIQVSDGNGLQIECDKDQGNDVFEAGIEIISKPAVVTPPIVVSAPPANSVFHQGDTLRVSWTADCARIGGVKVELTLDDGEYWTIIEASGALPCGTHTWAWVIPDSLTINNRRTSTVSTACRVRVANYLGQGEGLSPLFTIAPRSNPVRTRLTESSRFLSPLLSVRHRTDGGVELTVDFNGSYSVGAWSIDGREVWRATGCGMRTFLIPLVLSERVLLVRFHSDAYRREVVILPRP